MPRRRQRRKYFIAKAIKRPGMLTRRARGAGETVLQFARRHRHSKGLVGQQARFFLNVLRPAILRRKRKTRVRA